MSQTLIGLLAALLVLAALAAFLWWRSRRNSGAPATEGAGE